LNKAEAVRLFGFDDAGMKLHGSGIFRSFTSNGHAPDVMRMKLEEFGYPVGNGIAEFGEVIESAMRGEDVYALEGQEAAFNAQMEEYNAGYDELSESEQNALDAAVAKATELYGADTVAMIDAGLAASMEGQPTAVIERELLRTLNEQFEQDERTDAIQGNAGNQKPAAGSQEESPGTDRQETGLELEGQTSEQLNTSEQAKAAQRKADAEEKSKAEADSKVNDFTLTGSDRPADEAAARGAQDLFASEEKAKTVPLKDTSDVGIEMLGNRRNKGLTLSDIQNANNDTTRVAMAVKTKLWERPDYQELVDSGVQPVIAHIIKQVYDSLSSKPASLGQAMLYNYVETVEAAKKAVDEFLMDESAMAEMIVAVAVKARQQSWMMGGGVQEIGKLSNEIKLNENALNYFVDRIFPKNDHDARWGRNNKEGNDKANSTGNRFYQKTIIDLSMFVDAMKAVEQGFPAKQELWERSYQIKELGGKFELVKKGRYTAISTHDTREEAAEAARELVKTQREEAFKEPETPVEKSIRKGREIRTKGNVSSQELKDTIGLKAVNFGNWMKQDTNAEERQAHVNSAFDAFHDLAEILGLPVKSMSLEGMLGLAIGAQGKGKFAAHFYPGYNEINLTRGSGAGSLAHEWAHGLDHYFGVQAGMASKTEPFASWITKNRNLPESDIRPEIVNAFKTIIEAMSSTTETLETVKARTEAYAKDSKERLDRYIETWDLAEKVKGDQKAEAALEEIRKAELGEYVEWPPLKGRRKAQGYTWEQVKTIADKLGWDYSMADGFNSIASGYKYGQEQLEAEPKLRKIHTEYYREASMLDGKKSKPYWTTPHELFARAFEMYVADKISNADGRNDYLVASWKLAEEINTGVQALDEVLNEAKKRYPQGAEREAINAAFDVLFNEIKTKETENGIALFSRAGASGGMGVSNAQEIIDEISKKYPALPPVIVVADSSEMPADKKVLNEISGQKEAQKRALSRFFQEPTDANFAAIDKAAVNDIEGMYADGKLYINAGAIQSEERLREVYAHEGIGHLAIEAMLNEVDPKLFNKLTNQVKLLDQAGNKYIRKLAAAVDSSQPGLDKNQRAQEILAQIAERGDQDKEMTSVVRSLWQRIADGIRAFAKLVFDVTLTDRDVRDIMAMAARHAAGEDVTNVIRNSGAVMSRMGEPATLASLFKAITANDEVFQYAISDSKDLQTVFNDVVPGRVSIEKATAMDDDVAELYAVFPIKNGKPEREKIGYINVFKDGNVEINVGSWGEGLGGSGIYAAVGNWAFNNGKVFAGDREGISPTGAIRRLENMISLALKFGTTDFIKPHPNQKRELEFNWRDGDFAYNLEQMLEASYRNIRYGTYIEETNYGITARYKSGNAIGVSKIDDLIYNIESGQFEDKSSGKPFTDSHFKLLAQTKAGRGVDAGRSTLQRAVIAHTYMGETREGKQRLLEFFGRLSDQSLHGLSLKGIFYSRTQDQTRTESFKKWFGDSKVVDADGKPVVVYHGTDQGENFTEFDTMDFGSWFGDRNTAERYKEKTGSDNPRIYEVYLSIQNPLYIPDDFDLSDDFDMDEALDSINKANKTSFTRKDLKLPKGVNAGWEAFSMNDRFIDAVQAAGYDGLNAYEEGKATWNAFTQGQIKSAIGNNGDFDGGNGNIMYSRQGNLQPKWDDLPPSKMGDDIIYALQDKHIDLKRVTQAIKKAAGDIYDRWNAYLQEELFHGRTAKRTQDFIKNELDPLIEDMRMRGVKMADFEEYLWMRHAEERNKQIAKVNPEMPDGGSGINTADAKAYLSNLSAADKSKYAALAKRVDEINAGSRQVLLDYGLESDETIAAWGEAYKHYVPLMREDMDLSFGNGSGQGYSIKGNAAKRATGSKRAVVDILANMAQQRERNIIRGEKNRVSTALIGLAKLNPNTEFWKTDTVPMVKTIGASGLVEEHPDANYKNRDNVVVARVPNKLGRIVEHSVIFNQHDQRAMRMSASIKNLDQDQIGEMLGAAASVTRYFASINTQYNPIFGLLNITRDIQGALFNLSSTKLAGKQKAVLAGTKDILKSALKAGFRMENLTGADKQLWEDFRNEGGQTGYRDMFRNARERAENLEHDIDPEWWQKEKWGQVISLNGALAPAQQWLVSKPGKAIFQWLSDYNEALENSVRLSAFKVGLDNGMTKQQAASLAKNLTVNFNRKGEMGRQIGALYAFFNASVQGTARLAETLFVNKDGKVSLSKAGKNIMMGGLLLGAMQALAMAAAGFDEDEPPEFVRDRNIVIPIGNGKYLTIPMPLGFNVIPAIGRIVVETMMYGKPQERFVHALDVFFDMFNPIGNAGLSMQTLSPTVLDPIAALAENKDFAGRPIAQKDFNSLDPTPGHTRAKDTASSLGVGISYVMNALTGGTDYKPGAVSPTPDQIDYLIGQAFGGVGREAMKVENTLTATATGSDLPAHKMPLVGRLYGDTDGQSSQGAAFYKNITDINEHENEIKGRRKNGGDVAAYMEDHPEAGLYMQANHVESVLRRLRKQRRALIEKGGDVEAINSRITEVMRSFNEKVKARKEAA
jgi:hypothetical protein